VQVPKLSYYYYRVTDFFRTMTAEQKAEYAARQAVEAADKRWREEQYLSEAARARRHVLWQRS
jgi:hypothetical protein